MRFRRMRIDLSIARIMRIVRAQCSFFLESGSARVTFFLGRFACKNGQAGFMGLIDAEPVHRRWRQWFQIMCLRSKRMPVIAAAWTEERQGGNAKLSGQMRRAGVVADEKSSRFDATGQACQVQWDDDLIRGDFSGQPAFDFRFAKNETNRLVLLRQPLSELKGSFDGPAFGSSAAAGMNKDRTGGVLTTRRPSQWQRPALSGQLMLMPSGDVSRPRLRRSRPNKVAADRWGQATRVGCPELIGFADETDQPVDG